MMMINLGYFFPEFKLNFLISSRRASSSSSSFPQLIFLIDDLQSNDTATSSMCLCDERNFQNFIRSSTVVVGRILLN